MFTALELHWAYEPEGYHLDNGQDYLPDFYIPQWDAFVEIKPTSVTEHEGELCSSLALGSGKNVHVFDKGIPWLEWGRVKFPESDLGTHRYLPDGAGDDGYMICFCHGGRRV